MSRITISLGGVLLAAFLCAPAAARAECGVVDGRNQVSAEAMRIIDRQELKKVEAEAAIDRETAQLLLGRIFDLETGRPLPLPNDQKERYSADATFFAKWLREDADAGRAKYEAMVAGVRQCDQQSSK